MQVYLIIRFYAFSTVRVKTTLDRVFANINNLPHYQYQAIREIKIERI